MANSDFLNVELSAAGVEMVGAKGAVRFTKAHMNYMFTPGAPVRVLTSEWSRTLSKQLTGGKPILQLAAAAAATVATTDPEAKLNELKAEEAQVEAQIAQKAKGGK